MGEGEEPEEVGKPVVCGKPEESGNPVGCGKPEEVGKPGEREKPGEVGNPVVCGKTKECGKMQGCSILEEEFDSGKYSDEDAGIYLRKMTLEDTDNIVAWRNSDGVRKHFIYQGLFTRESHENWIHTMVETGRVVQLIICERAGDRPIGSVYIRDIDEQHHKGEYGIFIGEETARGRGLGTAAARLMIRYAFEELKLHRLFLRVYAENARAIGSYEKAGFVREAYLHDDVYVDGSYRDIVLMAVINKIAIAKVK